QQRLSTQAAGESVRQAVDRLGLIAGRLERGDEAEIGHPDILALERPFEPIRRTPQLTPPDGAGGRRTYGACRPAGAPTHSGPAPTCPEVPGRGTPTPSGRHGKAVHGAR